MNQNLVTSDQRLSMDSPDQLPTIKETLAHYNLVQQVLKEIMKEGTHYGASFPGDIKKNLLKPGADTLCVAFQFVPEFTVEERDLEGGHREYRVNCTIKTRHNGTLVAQGVGTCSTMESKYRYRNAAIKCPHCGKEAVIKGKADYGGGWLCYQKKGGCGAKWADGAKEIEGQERGKVVNEDPADVWNTVLKISKKRAFVDATITATGASDLFTQDAEEIAESLKTQQAAPAQAHQEAPEVKEVNGEPVGEQAAPAGVAGMKDDEKLADFDGACKMCQTSEAIEKLWERTREEWKKSGPIPTKLLADAYALKNSHKNRLAKK